MSDDNLIKPAPDISLRDVDALLRQAGQAERARSTNPAFVASTLQRVARSQLRRTLLLQAVGLAAVLVTLPSLLALFDQSIDLLGGWQLWAQPLGGDTATALSTDLLERFGAIAPGLSVLLALCLPMGAIYTLED